MDLVLCRGHLWVIPLAADCANNSQPGYDNITVNDVVLRAMY